MNEALQRITRARTHLLLDNPFFGSLAMRLAIEENTAVTKTMATDGTHLYYAADFVMESDEAELVAVVAHEVMHCVLLHPYRRGGRDKGEWNEATDYAINAELKKYEGTTFRLPSDVLYDPQFDGMSAEAVFAKRRREKEQQQDQGGGQPPQGPQQGGSGAGQSHQNQPQPGQQAGQPQQQPGCQPQPGGNQPGQSPLSTGEVLDAPPQDPNPGLSGGQAQTTPMTADDWKIAAEQAAAVCKAAGNDPGDAARAAKAAKQPIEDWRAELQEFIEHQVPSDYSWTTPNRRHIATGLYLPGVYKENLGYIALAVDTSGSITQSLLDLIAEHVTAILHEARPERVLVIYCDSAVRHTEEFNPDDPEVVLDAKGGGGTRFQPVFSYLADQAEPPTCLLYFTDLESSDRPQEPAEYPVAWVTGIDVRKSGPFGRTIRVDQWA